MEQRKPDVKIERKAPIIRYLNGQCDNDVGIPKLLVCAHRCAKRTRHTEPEQIKN